MKRSEGPRPWKDDADEKRTVRELSARWPQWLAAAALLSIIAFVAAVLGSGCSRGEPLEAACDPELGAACERHLVCAPGPYPGDAPYTCQYGDCYQNNECAPGELCVGLTCMSRSAAGGAGLPCADDADCPRHLECRPGLEGRTCQPLECYRDTDCPPVHRCWDGRCLVPPPC